MAQTHTHKHTTPHTPTHTQLHPTQNPHHPPPHTHATAFLCVQSHTQGVPPRILSLPQCARPTPHTAGRLQPSLELEAGADWFLLYVTKPHAPRCPAGSAPSISPRPHPRAPRTRESSALGSDAGSGGAQKESLRSGRGGGSPCSFGAPSPRSRRDGELAKGRSCPPVSSHPVYS